MPRVKFKRQALAAMIEAELHFTWCIAGSRYRVGDKNQDFLTGKVDRLTA